MVLLLTLRPAPSKPRWAAVFWISLSACGPSWAGCGLEYCPRPSAGTAWEAEAAVGRTRFDLPGVAGTYQVLSARVAYRGWKPWTAGSAVPLVRLEARGRKHTGLGAPFVYADRRLASGEGGTLNAGTQLELGVGDDGAGLAPGHMEAMPYAAYEWASGPLCLSVRAGYHHSFAGHGHGERPVLVHPHEDNELVYRLGFGWTKPESLVKTEFFLDGQHGPAEDGRGPGFLAGGLSLLFPVNELYDLRATGEHAATHPRRFDSRATLSLIARW